MLITLLLLSLLLQVHVLKVDGTGMFQLMALASVLERPIFSVYPIAASASTMTTQGMVKLRISIKDHVNEYNLCYVVKRWST